MLPDSLPLQSMPELGESDIEYIGSPNPLKTNEGEISPRLHYSLEVDSRADDLNARASINQRKNAISLINKHVNIIL